MQCSDLFFAFSSSSPVLNKCGLLEQSGQVTLLHKMGCIWENRWVYVLPSLFLCQPQLPSLQRQFHRLPSSLRADNSLLEVKD